MKRWHRAAVVTLLTVLAGTAALAVATGAVASVATRGVSMEPRFHTGDLAVVRAAETYRVGDVVAYRSEMLDTVVMHRIVAVDAHAAAATIGIPAAQVDVAVVPTVTTRDGSAFAPELKLALTPLQLTLPGGASSLTAGEPSPATTGSSAVPRI